MAITVGTDTYVTIAEADTYIEEHYVSTDTQRVTWEALSDTDKEIYLRNATLVLEDIPYRGRKSDSDQTLAFPRCYKSFDYISDLDTWYTKDFYYCSYYCESETPDSVKYAQIHEALENASPSDDSDVFNSRNSNVKSYSVTGLSETFQNVNSSYAGVTATLMSKKAQRLIHKYAGGGFGVR